jgi:peptide deformylase
VAVLDIRTYPDPVLREKARPVAEITDDLRLLIDEMTETMYAASGVGLAAPQVGRSVRVIVVDVSAMVGEGEPGSGLIALVNPAVRETDGVALAEEGCLSLPDFTTEVRRAERVVVTGIDRDGARVEIEAEGFFARALQHEIDHLEGTLIIDSASYLSREFYKKKARKRQLQESGH